MDPTIQIERHTNTLRMTAVLNRAPGLRSAFAMAVIVDNSTFE